MDQEILILYEYLDAITYHIDNISKLIDNLSSSNINMLNKIPIETGYDVYMVREARTEIKYLYEQFSLCLDTLKKKQTTDVIYIKKYINEIDIVKKLNMKDLLIKKLIYWKKTLELLKNENLCDKNIVLEFRQLKKPRLIIPKGQLSLNPQLIDNLLPGNILRIIQNDLYKANQKLDELLEQPINMPHQQATMARSLVTKPGERSLFDELQDIEE